MIIQHKSFFIRIVLYIFIMPYFCGTNLQIKCECKSLSFKDFND